MKRTPLPRGTKQLKRSGFAKPSRETRMKRGKGALGRTQRKKKHSRSKPKLTTLKTKLWALVRVEVFKLYGTNCFTCPATKLVGSNLQCGHVPWPKSILPAKCAFDVRFLRPQCYNCNINRGGMGAEAFTKMLLENPDRLALMEVDRHILGKADAQFYLDEIAKYEIPNLQTLPQPTTKTRTVKVL